MNKSKLLSTQNTRVVETRVRRAARELGFHDFYHWWIVVNGTGKTYDAVDALGEGTYDGFAFEEV